MGQISINLDKVLEVFYENPGKRFTVREISKRTKIPKSTGHKYLVELEKQGWLKEGQAANTDIFKIKKSFFYIDKLYKSGLIDFLKEELSPSCIILFGSFRKGESDKDSDIDLFVESNKARVDLAKFERKLKHTIQLFIEKDIRDLPDRLYNNVVNGIKLSGFFKVR